MKLLRERKLFDKNFPQLFTKDKNNLFTDHSQFRSNMDLSSLVKLLHIIVEQNKFPR